MKIFKTCEILKKLDLCIRNRKPFSVIRFGDGGIKLIDAILHSDIEQINIIVRKEGLSAIELINIFELWGYYARRADFIDSPQVYFNGKFWPRMRSTEKRIKRGTENKLKNWESLYYSAEFDNSNYCNPELNYLMITRIKDQNNLLDIMKNRKICIITTFPEVREKLLDYNIDALKIVGQYQDQYNNSYKYITERIKTESSKYDIWLVAAGELGRIYSGMIKEYGGRAIDIGFVVEFWLGGDIHPRLHPFLVRNENNPLELELTTKGKEYEDLI